MCYICECVDPLSICTLLVLRMFEPFAFLFGLLNIPFLFFWKLRPIIVYPLSIDCTVPASYNRLPLSIDCTTPALFNRLSLTIDYI